MYNRYIPTADGGFQRMIVESAACQPEQPQTSVPEKKPCAELPTACETRRQSSQKGLNLRQLDTGDLLVLMILLLLLVDGDEEDLPCALLTIAAFLFL